MKFWLVWYLGIAQLAAGANVTSEELNQIEVFLRTLNLTVPRFVEVFNYAGQKRHQEEEIQLEKTMGPTWDCLDPQEFRCLRDLYSVLNGTKNFEMWALQSKYYKIRRSVRSKVANIMGLESKLF